MSKALVIKGASFAANKVETVELLNPILCTGITLSKSSKSLTSIGATFTLTATVTPADTTEAVTWSSSNTNAVTVSNGVVTAVGVGAATITASCGSQSATCAVTVTVSLAMNSKFKLDGYEMSATDLSANPPKDYVGTYAAATRRIYADSTNTLSGYKAFSGNNDAVESAYPIAIPNGTTKISATFPTGFTMYKVALLNANEHPTYGATNPGAKAIAITDTLNASSGAFEYTIPDVTGYNSFVFHLRTSSGNASGVTGDVTVTFS